MKHAYVVGDARYEVEVHLAGDRLEGRVSGPDGDVAVDGTARRTSPNEIALRIDDTLRWATVLRRGEEIHVALDGHVFVLRVEDRAADRTVRAVEEPHAVSPMTGTLVKVAVGKGQAVAKGAPLFVVEAMKMEYVVKAPRDVVVSDVRASAGAKVALGDVVVAFEAPA